MKKQWLCTSSWNNSDYVLYLHWCNWCTRYQWELSLENLYWLNFGAISRKDCVVAVLICSIVIHDISPQIELCGRAYMSRYIFKVSHQLWHFRKFHGVVVIIVVQQGMSLDPRFMWFLLQTLTWLAMGSTSVQNSSVVSN